MQILKTKYYPVNMATKEVLLAPHDCAQEIERQWTGLTTRYVAITGEQLLKHKCYQSYNYVAVEKA